VCGLWRRRWPSPLRSMFSESDVVVDQLPVTQRTAVLRLVQLSKEQHHHTT